MPAGRLAEDLVSARLLAIVRLGSYARAVEVAQALVAGGVRLLEFSLVDRGRAASPPHEPRLRGASPPEKRRTPSGGDESGSAASLSHGGAVEAVSRVRQALGDAAHVGLGTVLGVAQADAGIAAGAQFVVTPILRPEVVALCRARAVPVVCGASTPTEVVAAHEAGADFVKVFPSRLGGPGYFRDLLAPMPWLRLVAVGGVSVANAGDYLAAGATAVGIGASLVPADAVEAGDFARITAAARSLCLLAAGSPWPSAARGLES